MVVLVAAVFLCSKICTSTQSEELHTESSLPPLRSNEQMLEFILKSAKEWFGDSNIALKEYGYRHGMMTLQLAIPYIDDQGLIVIYPCADKTEYDYVNNCLGAEAATEFRSYPVCYYDYGNMVIVWYTGEKYWQVEQFLESVVIDTREGLVLAQRWQEWLAEKGVEMKIADDGFGFVNHSLSGLVSDVCQTLPLLVDDNKVELICCGDTVSAQRVKGDLGHMYSVMDIIEGRDYYAADRYGRFLVMTLKSDPLIKEFWSKQNLK